MADNLPVALVATQEPEDAVLSNAPSHQDSPGAAIDEKGTPDVPPDGGYGWVCVACVFWINAHTWGINSSYGVFLSYYLSHNVFPGATPLAYAFTGGLSISCALLIAPLATYLIQLYGTRIVLNIGVFFETLSMIGSSFATQKWHIFLSQGVCFGWGMGFLFVGTVGVIPQWFLRRRSVAMGVTAAGSGLGGLIFSLAVGAIIPKLGLAWTFRILAIISCVVNLICSNLIKDRNKAVGSRLSAFHLPLLERPEFLLFLGWGVLSMLGYVALLFSVANYALSVGLTAHQGSVISALLNLGQGLGRPFVGMFSDRLGRINIATGLTFLCGVFCLVIWIFAKSMGVVSFFAVLVGTVSGTYWATVSPVLAEIIGLRDLPSGLSITWIALVAPCTVSEAIALVLRDTAAHTPHSAYLRVQIFTGFMYLGAALCLWVVRGWKVGDLVRAEEEEAASAATTAEAEAAASSTQSTAIQGNGSPPVLEKPETHCIAPAVASAETSGTVKAWSIQSLLPRMVALKRV